MMYKVLFFIIVAGCTRVPGHQTPAKTAQYAATTAAADFWHDFMRGRYEYVDEHIIDLSAAYRKNPNNPEVAAFLGAAHLWKFAEYTRIAPERPPEATLWPVIAENFLADAVEMRPDWTIVKAIKHSSMLLNGQLQRSPHRVENAYQGLSQAIEDGNEPIIPMFVFGYEFAREPVDSPYFTEALEMIWNTIDKCIGGKISRDHPDMQVHMAKAVKHGPQRFCWNTEKAPHVMEGVFIALGDMLRKKGAFSQAKAAYANVRLSPNFSTWGYTDLLVEREALVASTPTGADLRKISSIPFVGMSMAACTVCHVSRSTL